MGLFNVWDIEFHLNFLTGIKTAEVVKVKLYGEVLIHPVVCSWGNIAQEYISTESQTMLLI